MTDGAWLNGIGFVFCFAVVSYSQNRNLKFTKRPFSLFKYVDTCITLYGILLSFHWKGVLLLDCTGGSHTISTQLI